jgi:hypothetical protein
MRNNFCGLFFAVYTSSLPLALLLPGRPFVITGTRITSVTGTSGQYQNDLTHANYCREKAVFFGSILTIDRKNFCLQFCRTGLIPIQGIIIKRGKVILVENN